MSKETEPIRSRREMREQSAHRTGAPEVSAVPEIMAPVSPANRAHGATEVPTGTADAGKEASAAEAPLPRERQSQTRARDRAALRAYKDLVDPGELSPLPSRKTLRQAQLDAERAPITAVNPVISVTSRAGKAGASPQTSQSPAVALTDTHASHTTSEASTDSTRDVPADATEQSASAGAPTPAGSAVPGLTPVPRTRAGRRAAPATSRRQTGTSTASAGTDDKKLPGALAPEAVTPLDVPPAAVKMPSPPTALPSSAALFTVDQAGADQGAASISADGEGAPSPQTAATPDAAAAAEVQAQTPLESELERNSPPMPGLVPGGSYYPISAGPPVAPSTEELQVLAAKRAESERAAILAQRAQARERLVQENAKNRRPPADPTATNNLAMVTPMEFIDVPGMDQRVMRPPATTHVPIVTRSTPRQAPAKARAVVQPSREASGEIPDSGPTVPNVSAERFDAALAARAVHRPGPGNRPLTGGRSSTIKRAEAMANGEHTATAAEVSGPYPSHAATAAEPVQRSQMPPMPADYAHGLEPLDAMTAGLRRTQRNLLIQWGSIILGGAALVVSVIVILTNTL